MDMIAGHLPCYDVNLMLNGNLSQYVSSPYSNLPRQYTFPVFRNPNQVDFQIRFCMSTKLVTSHSDSI